MSDESLTFEVAEPSDAVPVSGLLGCTLAGAFAGIVAAAGIGARYLGANPDVSVEPLVVPFALYVIATGACAFGGLRLAFTLAPRSPVIAGALAGTLLGIAPGAWGASTFGSQPLPFVGAASFAFAAVPFVVLGVFAQAIAAGGSLLRSLVTSVLVTVAVGALGGAIAFAAVCIGATDMLEALRSLLFLGLERVGALTGMFFGLVVGAAQGFGVRTTRA